MDNDWEKKGVLRRFSQKLYVDATIFDHTGLDDYGYVYYPYTCIGKDKRCKLHFALHGCTGQVNGLAGWDFIVRYGYT